MNAYLESSEYINWRDPKVLARAKALAANLESDEETAAACFEFVRDEIRHSWDHKLNPVTIRASEVLLHGTGFCYAKSHLLAALLRANGIPAGLCYQRLTLDGSAPPFCLHGLNAVHLKAHGWYRIDARGNKPGVEARFCPPHPRLAFPGASPGEANVLGIFSEPLPTVIHALEKATNFQELANDLPDLDQATFASDAAYPYDPISQCLRN